MRKNSELFSPFVKSPGSRTSGMTAAAVILAGSFLAPAAIHNAQAEDPSGRQIYKANCAMCHKSGLNAAPKYNEDRAWQPIVAQGKETVYKNSIEGIGSMPPRGGNANLTDAEVKAAVDFMVGAVGGWPE